MVLPRSPLCTEHCSQWRGGAMWRPRPRLRTGLARALEHFDNANHTMQEGTPPSSFFPLLPRAV